MKLKYQSNHQHCGIRCASSQCCGTGIHRLPALMKAAELQVSTLRVMALGHYLIFIIFTSSEGCCAATLSFESHEFASPLLLLILLNIAALLTKVAVLRIAAKFCNFVQGPNKIQILWNFNHDFLPYNMTFL